MALAAFSRLADSVLAVLGEDAVLRSDEGCRVNVEQNVEVTDPDGGIVFEKHVLTLHKSLAPAAGDVLAMGTAAAPTGQRFALDFLLEDRGYTVRYVARELAGA